jgi:hypothetical protein
MKKISILLNIALLCFIIVQSCSCPKNMVDSQRLACPTSVCLDYSGGTFKYLDHKVLAGMVDLYNSNMGSQLSFPSQTGTNTSGADTRSMWLPLEKLKEFIWEIESKCCQFGCDPKPDLGVRFYYSRYTKKAVTDFSLDADYENRHTLFMVPTYDASDGANIYHYDFDPRYWSKSDCAPLPLGSAITLDSTSKGMQILQNGITALAITSRNHGQLCPPLCKPSNNTIDDYFTENFLP